MAHTELDLREHRERSQHAGPDLMITASALSHQATVVTRNVSDFKATGAELLNPFEYLLSSVSRFERLSTDVMSWPQNTQNGCSGICHVGQTGK